MSAPDPHPKRFVRLADRMIAARRKHFVGRVAEIELFRLALLEAVPPFAVLHLYGPGGVGKTTLLQEYARIAAESGCLAVRIDGRNLDPSPAAFWSALSLALDLPAGASTVEVLAQAPRSVVLIDTYETLAPLDTWLREIFLPQLPAQTLVVIAGRNPPVAPWRTAIDWRDLVRIVSLRNLRPEESQAYLSAQGIPQAQYPAVLSFTHGHPLALSLVADVLAQSNQPAPFIPENEPDVVRVLLERFVQHVPSPAHRQALEACAHARVTTEALLAEALNTADAPALFEWLRGLSFIEQGPQGLFPHDMAREVLDADLRWRNPEIYRELHRRLRDPIVRKMQTTRGLEQQRAFFDLLYLHRNNPLMRPYYEWASLGSAYAEPAATRDHPAIVEMIRRHEGATSAQIVQHWLQRQPAAFTIFRAAAEQPIGFIATLALQEVTPEDREVDPAVQVAWDFAQRYNPARPGEALIYHRFWTGSETYQVVSAVHNMVALTCTTYWLTTPNLAWSFLACADPDYWHPMFSYLNFRRTPEVDFAIGSQPFAVYTHDWRAEPALAWLEVMAQRELATDLTVERVEPTPSAPMVVLSQPEFAEAVRQALRNYQRPAVLATNPLLRSRLVAEQAAQTPDPATLQALLREAAATLKANPKDVKLYRAIWHTYLEPANTQELAAELLGLPFSTYRYHLANGIDRMVELLWQRELYGNAS